MDERIVIPKTVNINLNIENEKPILVSVDCYQDVRQLKRLICDQYRIPIDNQLILIDGLLVEDDIILKHMFIEPTPSIDVCIGTQCISLTLRYLEYTCVSLFPLNLSVAIVISGFNSFLIREYGDMMYIPDIVVMCGGEEISTSTLLSTLNQSQSFTIDFVIPENKPQNPFVQQYAEERQKRFQVEEELDECQNDISRLVEHSESLQTQNQSLLLQVRTIFENGNPTAETVFQTLQEENTDLQNMITSLNEKYSSLQRQSRESDAQLEDSQRQHDQYELYIMELRNTIQELEIAAQSDIKRIDNLHTECGDLSGKLNESMEVMEKYKMGYVNMKRRAEKQKTMVKQSASMEKQSGYFRCGLGMI